MPSVLNQVLKPVVCKPIVKGQQNISMLEPLAGVISQNSTPYVSNWLFIGAGSALQLSLTLANFVGTFFVYLETVGKVGNPPRYLAFFEQTPGVAGSVELFGPMPVCDDYVRVIATPGTGPGQTCDWTVTGQALVPFAPIT
jgi:hypothetical protein